MTVEILIAALAAIGLLYAIAQSTVIGLRFPPFTTRLEFGYGAATFATIVGSLGILLKRYSFFEFYGILFHFLFFSGAIGIIALHIVFRLQRDEDHE